MAFYHSFMSHSFLSCLVCLFVSFFRRRICVFLFPSTCTHTIRSDHRHEDLCCAGLYLPERLSFCLSHPNRALHLDAFLSFLVLLCLALSCLQEGSSPIPKTARFFLCLPFISHRHLQYSSFIPNLSRHTRKHWLMSRCGTTVFRLETALDTTLSLRFLGLCDILVLFAHVGCVLGFCGMVANGHADTEL